MSEIGVDSDFASMKVAELKKELKNRGLSTAGKKEDLVERLQMAVMGTDGDILAEAGDLLDGDDEDIDEGAEDEAGGAGGDGGGAQKEKEEPKVVASVTTNTKPKKVSINRDVANAVVSKPEEPEKPKPENVISTKPVEAEPEKPKTTSAEGEDAKTESEGASTAEKENSEKKVISPGMTDAEKARIRAEKFGVKNENTKKMARAERFGLPINKSNDKTFAKIGGAPPADLEKLKKRAERFGQNTSSALKSEELDEKLKRRQERFGVVSKDEPKPKKLTLNSGVNSVVMDEKMKKRAERFGTSTA